MPWTRTLTAFGFHVAISDHEHGVDFHLLGVGDLGFDVVAAGIELGADLVGAEFGLNCAGVFEERRFIADRQDADLFGREPEREIAGVMLDQEADETFVRAERRAMDAERRLVGVVAVVVGRGRICAGTAKSTWLVAMVNSRPMALQTWTSIFGP